MMSLSKTKNNVSAHMGNVKRLGLAQITDLNDVSYISDEEVDPVRSFFSVEIIACGVWPIHQIIM